MSKHHSQKVAELLLIVCTVLAVLGLLSGGIILFKNYYDQSIPVLEGLFKANTMIIAGSVGALILCAVSTGKGRSLFNFSHVSDNYSLIKFFTYLGAWGAINIISIKSLSGVNLTTSYLSFRTFESISVYPTILTLAGIAYIFISASEVMKIMTEKVQPSKKM